MFMNSFLLRSILDFIESPIGIASLICMIVGLAIFCSAWNFTRAIRKTKDIKTSDKVFIFFASLGIIIFLVGIFLIFMINPAL